MTEGSGPVRPLGPPGAPAPPLKTADRRAHGRHAPSVRVPRWAWYALGAVAIAAVAVWFLALRDTGNPFAGTWKAAQGPFGQVVISGPGRHIEATFSGRDSSGAEKTFTVAAHKDGEDLVITVDDFAEAGGDAAEAEQVRAAFAAVIHDFRLVFSRRDATHLTATVKGRLVGVIDVGLDQRSAVLTKVD